MAYVARVESKRIGGTLRTAPEWLASARDSILGQAEQQLADRIVVLLLELQACPNNALLERERLVCHEVRRNRLHLLLGLPRVLEVGLKEVRFREVGINGLWGFDEERIELLPGPLL